MVNICIAMPIFGLFDYMIFALLLGAVYLIVAALLLAKLSETFYFKTPDGYYPGKAVFFKDESGGTKYVRMPETHSKWTFRNEHDLIIRWLNNREMF